MPSDKSTILSFFFFFFVVVIFLLHTDCLSIPPLKEILRLALFGSQNVTQGLFPYGPFPPQNQSHLGPPHPEGYQRHCLGYSHNQLCFSGTQEIHISLPNVGNRAEPVTPLAALLSLSCLSIQASTYQTAFWLDALTAFRKGKVISCRFHREGKTRAFTDNTNPVYQLQSLPRHPTKINAKILVTSIFQ